MQYKHCLHEKLGSICIFASIGHRQEVILVVFNSEAFIWGKRRRLSCHLEANVDLDTN